MGSGFESRDTMFSVKQRPWHGLGTVVESAPTIDEAIKLAGLDWRVELEEMYSSSAIKSTTTKMSVRVDADGSRFELGNVGMQYTPLQNLEAFKKYEPLLDSGLIQLETAGSLFSGKKVFILAKMIGENLDVNDNDPIERFILLSNSHDGSSACRVGLTPVRVVCNNTLTMAHNSDKSQLISCKHTANISSNIDELMSLIDTYNNQFICTVEKFRELTQKDISQADLHKYIKQVFSLKSLDKIFTEQEEQEQAKNERLISSIEQIYETGRGVDVTGHNMWRAYNSVQEYLQYERGTNKSTSTLESQYNNLWFGDSASKNRKALEVALKW